MPEEPNDHAVSAAFILPFWARATFGIVSLVSLLLSFGGVREDLEGWQRLLAVLPSEAAVTLCVLFAVLSVATDPRVLHWLRESRATPALDLSNVSLATAAGAGAAVALPRERDQDRPDTPDFLRFETIDFVDVAQPLRRLDHTQREWPGKTYAFTVVSPVVTPTLRAICDGPLLGTPRVKALHAGSMEYDAYAIRDEDGELRHGRVRLSQQWENSFTFKLPEDSRGKGSRLWINLPDKQTRIKELATEPPRELTADEKSAALRSSIQAVRQAYKRMLEAVPPITRGVAGEPLDQATVDLHRARREKERLQLAAFKANELAAYRRAIDLQKPRTRQVHETVYSRLRHAQSFGALIEPLDVILEDWQRRGAPDLDVSITLDQWILLRTPVLHKRFLLTPQSFVTNKEVRRLISGRY